MRRVYPRATAPPNKPLQRPNARVVRLAVRLCRDGAGCARASSLPCYARGDRSAFAAERQIVIRTDLAINSKCRETVSSRGN